MKIRNDGMTLMELMIVIVIIGILAAVSIPAYQRHVVTTRRADAMGMMLAAAAAIERYKTRNNFVYTDADTANLFDTTIENNGAVAYDMTITAITANSYTLTATPRAGGRLDGDGALSITNTGVKVWVGHPDGWPDK